MVLGSTFISFMGLRGKEVDRSGGDLVAAADVLMSAEKQNDILLCLRFVYWESLQAVSKPQTVSQVHKTQAQIRATFRSIGRRWTYFVCERGWVWPVRKIPSASRAGHNLLK